MQELELENKRLKEVIRILLNDSQANHCEKEKGMKCNDCQYRGECYTRYCLIANEEYSLLGYKQYLWDLACGKING